MPGTDLSQFPADPAAAEAGMHVAVGVDPHTRNAVIVLDQDAADVLTDLLAMIEAGNKTANEAAHKVGDERVSVLKAAIEKPLLRLLGWQP